ncbi:MAG: hypothetical protein ACTSPB_26585, partial [Candidatus Thorarchaeota archaeon]
MNYDQYERRKEINGIAHNKNTGVHHLVALNDKNEITRVLCNASTENLEIGKGKRRCKRCWTVWDGTAIGHYDYSY